MSKFTVTVPICALSPRIIVNSTLIVLKIALVWTLYSKAVFPHGPGGCYNWDSHCGTVQFLTPEVVLSRVQRGLPPLSLSKVMSFSFFGDNILWTWVPGCSSISSHISFSWEQFQLDKRIKKKKTGQGRRR